jgi:enamidase
MSLSREPALSLAIVNIGCSHDGNGAPIGGDALICANGSIVWIGASSDVRADDHETTIDAAGATVIPGLIDSHFHSTFGDFTPRQNAVGYLESYLHGGMTRAISASEVHVPGRPSDRVGVKALAVAAFKCFEHYRPHGVTVHAGSVILEPVLERSDFADLRRDGVWMAKAGFGRFDSPMGYVPVVQAARAEGIHVMCHTGGGSISGSQSKIGADALLAMRPDVAGHVNGGPTALTREENERIVVEGTDIALQLVQAGNLKSAIHICELALEHRQLDRILIASDTPTGSGVITLGILRSMAELASLGPLTPEQTVTAATGAVGRIYKLDAGVLAIGRPADIIVVDAPLGSQAESAYDALRCGDVPAVAVAVTQGELRFARSRNTPPPKKPVRPLSAARAAGPWESRVAGGGSPEHTCC